MPTILIVNDDGVRSPLLAPLAHALSSLGSVRLAVPLEEQSWTAKAMSRFSSVRAHSLETLGITELHGLSGYAIEGTPSDCANLGIHELFAEAPDWVVSGINLGLNAGLNYLINSGTVGAAIEASLCGVPAIALSQRLASEMHLAWTQEHRLDGEAAAFMRKQAVTRAQRIVREVMLRGLPAGTTVLNVNFPIGMGPDTAARWVPVLSNRYGSLFTANGAGTFCHSGAARDTWREDGLPADKTVVEGGEIAITPLTLDALSLPDAEIYSL